MAVLKNHRHESTAEFVNTARHIYLFSIQKCSRFPKRYTFYLGQKIVNVAEEAYKYASLADFYPKSLQDARIREIADKIIERFPGDIGLGLGSQISQILALATPDRLDHFLKDRMQLKYHGRYNDDGYIIHESKEYLRELLEQIRRICDELHIELNTKKTHIVKLQHGFIFLKARYYLTENGKIIRKLPKKSAIKARRKIKKLTKKYRAGEVDLDTIKQSWQSWDAYAKAFQSWKSRQTVYQQYLQALSERRG